uniref:Transmembrane protein n=1 Tax=Cacopsylla melanoneura TaxID=428564 RepID=A0A8D8Y343_9HEMI
MVKFSQTRCFFLNKKKSVSQPISIEMQKNNNKKVKSFKTPPPLLLFSTLFILSMPFILIFFLFPYFSFFPCTRMSRLLLSFPFVFCLSVGLSVFLSPLLSLFLSSLLSTLSLSLFLSLSPSFSLYFSDFSPSFYLPPSFSLSLSPLPLLSLSPPPPVLLFYSTNNLVNFTNKMSRYLNNTLSLSPSPFLSFFLSLSVPPPLSVLLKGRYALMRAICIKREQMCSKLLSKCAPLVLEQRNMDFSEWSSHSFKGQYFDENTNMNIL